MLALVFIVKKFLKFLRGRHFTILTDHKPLLSIMRLRKCIPTYVISRLQRWGTILLKYDFDIKFCKNTDLGQSDGLSCLVNGHQPEDEGNVIGAISAKQTVT